MPARTLSTWSGHQRGGWHAAAHELATLVVVELEYYRQQFFILCGGSLLCGGGDVG